MNRPADDLLRPGERLDDLQNQGLRIIQRPDVFRFGTDAVLLADFAAPRPRERAVDLGCGTGVIALLLAAHEPRVEAVAAVELQPEIADMARRSVRLNSLEEKISVHNLDMREAAAALGYERYTLVVCNPPYGRAGATLKSAVTAQRIARHEDDLTPDDIAASASALLQNGGRFCAIYPAPRLLEMMQAMEAHRLAPKRVRTIHAVTGRAPKLILLDAVKGARPGLHWLPPLILSEESGAPTAEWRRIYRVEDTQSASSSSCEP